MIDVRLVHVQYHAEGDSWWAESSDVAGYTAAAASLTELRGLVHEGLPFLLEEPDLVIVEGLPTIDPALARVAVAVATATASIGRTSEDLFGPREFHQRSVLQAGDLASA